MPGKMECQGSPHSYCCSHGEQGWGGECWKKVVEDLEEQEPPAKRRKVKRLHHIKEKKAVLPIHLHLFLLDRRCQKRRPPRNLFWSLAHQQRGFLYQLLRHPSLLKIRSQENQLPAGAPMTESTHNQMEENQPPAGAPTTESTHNQELQSPAKRPVLPVAQSTPVINQPKCTRAGEDVSISSPCDSPIHVSVSSLSSGSEGGVIPNPW